MEIFWQETLPIDLGPGKDMNVSELRDLALKEFEAMKMKWSVSERYRQSVEACLEGIEDEDALGDGESFTRAFCQRIISPLETDYTSLWGNRDPDDVISELKLSSVKRKRPPPGAPKPAHFQVSPQLRLQVAANSL